MSVTFSTFLSYGALFSWFVAGPVLLIDKLNISPSKFGLLTAIGGGGAFSLAGYLNGKLLTIYSIKQMMRFGWSVMLTAGIIMSISYFIIGMNLWAIIVPAILFIFGSTFIWPNAFATAFTPFGHMAGYAGSMYGFMQICVAGLTSSIVAYLPDDSPLPLAIIMIISSALAWLLYEVTCSTKSAVV